MKICNIVCKHTFICSSLQGMHSDPQLLNKRNMETLKRNILKSVLFVCLGLTITTIVFASTRASYDVPGKPGAPLYTDYWKTGCNLSWTAPKSDGGSPITGYLIEVKEGWGFLLGKKVIVPGNQLRCTIEDMEEGTEAEFRVIASNKAGFGEPSDPSPRIIFKPRQ